jgi:hypothetical protein
LIVAYDFIAPEPNFRQVTGKQTIAMDGLQPPGIIKMSKLATGIVSDLNYNIYLLESICAQTAMSSILFAKLKLSNPSLELRQCNAQIQTCYGTAHGTAGLLSIKLTIGDKGIITININVMVVPNLVDKFLIGSDVLQSNLVVKTTPKSIYFKCPQTKKVIMDPFKITVFPIQPIKICRLGTVLKALRMPLTCHRRI